LLDQIMEAVERVGDGKDGRAISLPEMQRGDLVHALLAGAHVEPAEIGQLGYELDAWHLGIVATGKGATRALRDLKAVLGCELLLVTQGESVWAWLGRSSPIKTADLGRMLSRGRGTDVPLAFGDPGVGVRGWRLTHHQAREAWGVAIHLPQRLTWYADVLLLAAALRNDTLASSLKQKYLAPLRSEKDGGIALRKTLRAYIDAGCSATSAESNAGVGRHTVADRVQKAEQLIGQSVRGCLSKLDVALRLEELDEQRP
jgi:diguanylate cyclase with GGDEF domain/PucR-like helix-turn-helix protein